MIIRPNGKAPRRQWTHFQGIQIDKNAGESESPFSVRYRLHFFILRNQIKRNKFIWKAIINRIWGTNIAMLFIGPTSANGERDTICFRNDTRNLLDNVSYFIELATETGDIEWRADAAGSDKHTFHTRAHYQYWIWWMCERNERKINTRSEGKKNRALNILGFIYLHLITNMCINGANELNGSRSSGGVCLRVYSNAFST